MPGKRRRNGEGTISANADGTWRGAVTLADGKRRQFRAKTEEEARRKLTRLTHDRDRGLPGGISERLTCGKYFADWLKAVKPTIRENTWISYEHRVRLYVVPEKPPSIARVALIKLTAGHLKSLYADLLDARQLAPSTVAKTHGIIHHALKDAMRDGLIPRNVAELVDPPKVHKHAMTVYTPEQVDKLLTAIEGHKHETLYTLALTSGMRLGELLALKWADVDLASGFLTVREGRTRTAKGYVDGPGKTDSARRRIRLTSDAVASLKAHRTRQLEHKLWLGASWQEFDFVFPSEIGTAGDHSNVLHSFHRVTDAARLPRLRVHDLRHTAATLMLLKGVPAKVVSEMLGHRSIAITLDLYSHVLPDMQDQAVAAMESVFAERKSRQRTS
jgi:integrase